MTDEVAVKRVGRGKSMYLVKMPPEMHTDIFALADSIGCTPNDVINEALKLAMSNARFMENWQRTKRQQKIDKLEAELLRLKLEE